MASEVSKPVIMSLFGIWKLGMLTEVGTQLYHVILIAYNEHAMR